MYVCILIHLDWRTGCPTHQNPRRIRGAHWFGFPLWGWSSYFFLSFSFFSHRATLSHTHGPRRPPRDRKLVSIGKLAAGEGSAWVRLGILSSTNYSTALGPPGRTGACALGDKEGLEGGMPVSTGRPFLATRKQSVASDMLRTEQPTLTPGHPSLGAAQRSPTRTDGGGPTREARGAGKMTPRSRGGKTLVRWETSAPGPGEWMASAFGKQIGNSFSSFPFRHTAENAAKPCQRALALSTRTGNSERFGGQGPNGDTTAVRAVSAGFFLMYKSRYVVCK